MQERAFVFVTAIGITLAPLLARSILLALDFGAFIVFDVAVAAILWPLLMHFAIALPIYTLVGVVLVIAAPLIIAGAWRLSRGRIDLRANHRALSTFIWSSLGITLVVLFAFVTWAGSVNIHDLKYDQVRPAPAGSWM